MTNFKLTILRLIAVCSILFVTLHRRENGSVKGQICTNDRSWEYTSKLNSILRTDEFMRNVFQICVFGYLDVLIVIVAYLWILNGRNWKVPVSFGLFFLFREICNFSFQMRRDEDSLWLYPGVPSFSTSYRNSNDFFFSGSSGLFLICILELRANKFDKLTLFSVLMLVFHSALVISLRAEYYLSIVCGLFSAHYFSYVSQFHFYLLDELYDFDPERTERIRGEKLKDMIEISIKKAKEDKRLNYVKLDLGNESKSEHELEQIEVKESDES